MGTKREHPQTFEQLVERYYGRPGPPSLVTLDAVITGYYGQPVHKNVTRRPTRMTLSLARDTGTDRLTPSRRAAHRDHRQYVVPSTGMSPHSPVRQRYPARSAITSLLPVTSRWQEADEAEVSPSRERLQGHRVPPGRDPNVAKSGGRQRSPARGQAIGSYQRVSG